MEITITFDPQNKRQVAEVRKLLDFIKTDSEPEDIDPWETEFSKEDTTREDTFKIPPRWP